VHPRSRTWRQLLPGVVALTALVGTAVAILAFARVGALHGRTVRLHLLADHVDGVRAGSDVWMAGVRVGRVRAIRFRVPETDTLRRLSVDVDILARYRRLIRRDSRGTIRSGGTLLGEPVIWLRPGTAASAALPPGGTLDLSDASVPSDIDSALDTLAQSYRVLAQELARVRGAAATATARMDAVLGNPRWGAGALEHRLDELGTRISLRAGPAEGAVRDPLQRARGVMVLADSLLDLLSAHDTSASARRAAVARAQTARAMADLERQLARVRAHLTVADGTLGRLSRDSALAIQMTQLDSTLAKLQRDVHTHPLRYVPF
jgi:hypothetical protein